MANENILESEKKEVLLSINTFSKVAESSGVDAWSRQISNLLFMKKGSYITDPEMGCDLNQYDFAFIDDVINDIRENIVNQIQTYLPEIPFEGVTIRKDYSENGDPILLILLSFYLNDETNIVVVAAEQSNSLINFEIVI